MNRKPNANSNKQKKARRNMLRDYQQLGPPMIQSRLRFGTVLRYQKTGASRATVRAGALGALIYTAIAATTGTPVFSSVKLKKIEAWCPSVIVTTAAGFLANLLQIDYQGSTSATSTGLDCNRKVTDIPSGTRGGYVSLVPRAEDLGQVWMDVREITNIVFNIDGPVGTIVDVHVSFKLEAASGNAALLTCTSTTPGVIHVNFLDNSGSSNDAGTQILNPVFDTVNAAFWT